MRSLAFKLALAALLGFGLGLASAHVEPHTARADACRPAAECCRICDKGKACGDSCISRKFTCHKGRGCACDAEELCAE